MLFTYGAVVDRGAGLVARRHRCFATRGQGELHTIERGVAVGAMVLLGTTEPDSTAEWLLAASMM